MAAEDEVRAASRKFYAALNRMLGGDASSLGDIWSHSSTVSTMHPIGGREIGWEQVRASFEQVARSSTGGRVELTEQLIRIAGEFAYELGVERAQFSISGEPLSLNSRVTNIYRRQAGNWKVVHHHGDKSPGIFEALNRSKT
ncbi:MAG: nuclear transport factor 2 family protein [Alphaproteobacteria bacterium]|nr:nuclear transport factor 2 family protein [Alphaproteobacteria bacterium]